MTLPAGEPFLEDMWLRQTGFLAFQVDVLTASYAFAALEVVP